MRSRYSAFVAGGAEYLLWSWAPEHRPVEMHLDGRREWTGLEVLKTAAGGVFDDTGMVEFIATFTDRGVPGSQTETSQFRRHEGRWVYVSGAQ